MSDTISKGELAKSYFMQGYNCSQSVALAFCNEMGFDESLVARLTIGFGGGMGRLREVCGAVSGMTFVISALYDNDRAGIYPRVQAAANEFREHNGSIVCRELLGLQTKGADEPTPQERTAQYYKKRPCPELVAIAADILERYIAQNPYKQ